MKQKVKWMDGMTKAIPFGKMAWGVYQSTVEPAYVVIIINGSPLFSSHIFQILWTKLCANGSVLSGHLS